MTPLPSRSKARIQSSPEFLAARYAEEREHKRQSARERIHREVIFPIETPHTLRDPLVRHTSPFGSIILGARLLVAALLLHGFALLAFLALGQLMEEQHPQPFAERVQIRIVEDHEREGEPSPPPRHEEGAIASDFEVAPVPVAPRDAPPPRARRLIAAQESTPESSSLEQQEENDFSSPRRIVGLNFESTIEGGPGPSFATGTSRMGRSENVAEAPVRASRVPHGAPSGVGSAATNNARGTRQKRVASSIPSQGTILIKPKRTAPNKPPFPPALKAQGIEGSVLVRVSIDEGGHVTDVAILESSGHSAFDTAAQKAAQTEVFAPATKDGKPIPFTLTYSYRFRIED